MKLRGLTFALAASLLFLFACSSEAPPAETPKEAAPAADAAPSVDLLSGTWVLNISKSTYSPKDLAPKSGTSVFAPGPDGTKLRADGVNAKGQKTLSEYTTKFDGADGPNNSTVDGKPSPDSDINAWRKIDDHNYENVSKLKGQVMTTTKVVISEDGKTRTNTVTGKNAAGQTINNTAVYDKQ